MYFRLVFVLLLFCSNAFAQTTPIDSSITLLKISTGSDFTGVRGGNFGEVQPSFSVTLGKPLGRNLFIYFGIDFTNYRFKSDPFQKSQTTYVQWEPVTTIDTFHTVRYNRTKYIGIPIKLLYHNQHKLWSGYFSIGVNPCYNHWDLEYDQELINTTKISEARIDQGKGSGLFATGEAGISFNRPKWGFNLGVSSNYLLLRNSRFQEKLYSLGVGVGITKKFTPKETLLVPGELGTKSTKKNAFFVEIMGAGLVYSLNYERALVKTKGFSVQVRAGTNLFYKQVEKPDSTAIYQSTNLFPDSLNLFYYGNRFLLPHYLPVSLTAAFGKLNKLEIGMGISYKPKGSPGDGSYFLGEFGYRREDENNVLFRLTLTPLMNITTREILPYIGVSLGKRF